VGQERAKQVDIGQRRREKLTMDCCKRKEEQMKRVIIKIRK
jgi:hypothetical protein